jgi:hypothetical protein
MKNPDQPDLFGADPPLTPAPAADMPSIPCPKCNGKAWLTLASVLYKKLGRKYIYWCKPCDTRVGCHKDTTQPLGTPADAELRREREFLHKRIDPIWKADLQQRRTVDPHYKESKAKTKFYQRFATAMELNEDDCHIGKFDLAACRRATDLVKNGALERKIK